MIINLRNGRIWHDPAEILTRGASSRADSDLVILDVGPAPAKGFPPTRYYRWIDAKLQPLCQHFEVARDE